jgi:crotonobetainyl-CoA:carnitine CoA-transferase CaiB-like acyl-CoA transferase
VTAPLDAVRVVDFTRVLSGPSCTKALIDLGAEVIKVEPPEGDLTRTAQPRVDGIPVYFAQQNCGKRCVSVDLGTERGREIARGLIDVADVVVENYRPGVMGRLGLGYGDVSVSNPRLVYCSISGYGQHGSASGRRSYAPVVHAEMGVMEFAARKLGGDIRPEAVSHADLYSGLQAALAVTAALLQRGASGRGQHIDVSMAEVVLQATEWTAVEIAGGEEARLHVFGSFHAPVLRVADGTTVVVPGDPVSTFPAWCRVMGRPDLLEDERLSTPSARQANRGHVVEVLREWAATVPTFEQFEAAVGSERMAAGAVRSLRDALAEPWAQEREALVDVGTAGASIRLPRSPFRFSDADVGTHGRPAMQGEHNGDVLGELLGITADEVASLEAAGVLIRRAAEPGG